MLKKPIQLAFFSYMTLFVIALRSEQPKLTVVIVVDQFAHHYFHKLSPYFNYGLKFLKENGISYENAYMPNAMPSTGSGHTGLNTGAYAKDHGIVNNEWINQHNTTIVCDDDFSENNAVIRTNDHEESIYNYGKSPHNIMVDGISDSFMFASTPKTPHHVYSLSLKSRSAVCTANKLGKALWIDEKTGNFTSSRFYFKELPAWITTFNKQLQLGNLNKTTWNLLYPKKPDAYNFSASNNYTYAQPDHSIIGITYEKQEPHDKAFANYLEQTPLINDIIFKMAKKTIDIHVGRKKKDRMLLWVCLSSLDKIGHMFGYHSKEAIDMVYHLDKQLKDFMKFAQRKVGGNHCLFVLTADHGVAPIPEIAKEHGFMHAQRIHQRSFEEELNTLLEKKYKIKNLVLKSDIPNIYFNQNHLETLDSEKKELCLSDALTFFKKQPYIKNAWTYDQLLRTPFPDKHSLENNFKNQLFPHRSGNIIVQTYPNNLITQFPLGVEHKTPYEYDTHIPLILYQQGRFERKMVTKRVYALQLANTLATILHVPSPDASTFEVLPDLFDPEISE